MKLASYLLDNEPAWGIIDGEEAVHVGKVLQAKYADLKSVLAANALSEVELTISEAERSPLEQITWLPVVPNPDKILCVGLNY